MTPDRELFRGLGLLSESMASYRLDDITDAMDCLNAAYLGLAGSEPDIQAEAESIVNEFMRVMSVETDDGRPKSDSLVFKAMNECMRALSVETEEDAAAHTLRALACATMAIVRAEHEAS
jgi:hypothetical protein